MPSPTKPNVYPIWTQGNNSARQQPTNGEQYTGFTPNFRPPAGWHNWLFGIVSDWIAWLDFASNAANIVVSNVGHNILTGTNLQSQLDECDAFLSSLGLQPLTVSPTGNPLVYTVSPLPLNSAVPLVFLDGLDEEPTKDFTWTTPGGIGTITLGSALTPGQRMVVIALTANNPGSGGTSVSGGYVAHGSAGAPLTINPSAGITQPGDQRAMIFTESNGGVTPVTANPQISAGTKVGQELRLIGTSDVDALTLQDGNGLLLFGPITLGNGVSIDLYWNGSVWAESDRSN